MKKTNIEVSDHAIVRFLERVFGVDIDEIKKQILSDEMSEIAEQMGDGKYPIKEFGGKAVGIELSEEYCDIAIERLGTIQSSLL